LSFPDLEQFRVHDAGHARLGLEPGRRRTERGAVLPDIEHAGRRGLRPAHRSAGHLAHVRRPDYSTGSVFLRAGYVTINCRRLFDNDDNNRKQLHDDDWWSSVAITPRRLRRDHRFSQRQTFKIACCLLSMCLQVRTCQREFGNVEKRISKYRSSMFLIVMMYRFRNNIISLLFSRI